MKHTISSAMYKDQTGVMLESDILQALFLPQRGANLASLVYKPTGKQLLYQRPGSSFRVQPYDGVYTDAENAGMDDMFPTIDACFCNQAPWMGVPLPDHGEVWSLPWQEERGEDAVHLSVHGVRLPYTLEKRIHFPAPNVLRMDYRLTNHSPFPINYLWAAHAMFASEEGVAIVLPPGLQRMTVTFNINGGLGTYGDQFQWPVATLTDGTQRDLRQMRSADAKSVYKYYMDGALPQGWCAARFHHRGFAIGLSWPVDRVPYLAVLPNEGGWDDTTSLYFEPATATFDRPDIAQYHGEVSVIDGMATQECYLNIAITDDIVFSKVTSDGVFE